MKHNPFAHVGGLTPIELSTLDRAVQQLLSQLSHGPVPTHVKQLFPFPFTEYVRILPRAQVAGGGTGGEAYFQWKQLASYLGTAFPATTSVHHFLAREQDGLLRHDIRVEPYIGQLDAKTRHALADILQQRRSAAIQSYFFLRGHSGLGPDANLLYRGSVALLDQLRSNTMPWVETPDMWWAEDGSWCLTTPQDSPSAYFGATSKIVKAILDDERIEAYTIEGTDTVEDWRAR